MAVSLIHVSPLTCHPFPICPHPAKTHPPGLEALGLTPLNDLSAFPCILYPSHIVWLWVVWGVSSPRPRFRNCGLTDSPPAIASAARPEILGEVKELGCADDGCLCWLSWNCHKVMPHISREVSITAWYDGAHTCSCQNAITRSCNCKWVATQSVHGDEFTIAWRATRLHLS